jgi:hypothetical protein
MSELDNYKVQLRRATSSQWTLANTVLKNAEPAIETDTGKFKVGDGITPWVLLPYLGSEEEFIKLIRDVGPSGGPFQFIGTDVVMVDTLLAGILSTLALLWRMAENNIEITPGDGGGVTVYLFDEEIDNYVKIEDVKMFRGRIDPEERGWDLQDGDSWESV